MSIFIFGLVVSILASTITILFIANLIFRQRVKEEVTSLFKNAESKKEVVTSADIEKLPPAVKRWLTNAGVVGKERVRTVCLKQRGLIRMKQDAPWMEGVAEQYFTVNPPGFIWIPKFRLTPFLFFTGRDRYVAGQGKMTIKLLSLITVVDAGGKEIDQGAMVRYLGEMAWFPTAALSGYVKWEGIDDTSARATMNYGGMTASAVFRFSETGDVVEFNAQRYMGSTIETWSVPMGGHKELANGSGFQPQGKWFGSLQQGISAITGWRLPK